MVVLPRVAAAAVSPNGSRYFAEGGPPLDEKEATEERRELYTYVARMSPSALLSPSTKGNARERERERREWGKERERTWPDSWHRFDVRSDPKLVKRPRLRTAVEENGHAANEETSRCGILFSQLSKPIGVSEFRGPTRYRRQACPNSAFRYFATHSPPCPPTRERKRAANSLQLGRSEREAAVRESLKVWTRFRR